MSRTRIQSQTRCGLRSKHGLAQRVTHRPGALWARTNGAAPAVHAHVGCCPSREATWGGERIVRKVEHHIQDACEIYAVAELQRLAWEDGRGTETSYRETLAEFQDYLTDRELTVDSVRTGQYSGYISSVELHIPTFYERLTRLHPTGGLEFEVIEAQARNAKKKADFTIRVGADSELYEVSLKNYRESALRPQVCSGTYNSFLLNMLFSSPGVGTFKNLKGQSFRSNDKAKRDSAVLEVAGERTVAAFHELDELNSSMRETFLGPEFEFLDRERFRRVAQQVGRDGRDICLEQLRSFPRQRVRERVLTMAGLDGAEEALFFDPHVSTDSITNETFHHLLETVQDASTALDFEPEGVQSIRFSFRDDAGVEVLPVSVPFTINKNGAWISDKSFLRGPQYHKKEGKELSYNQRRPRKSREIATSVNTYVEYAKAGIFQ